MTFILPSFGASAISTVPGGGGGFNTYSVDFDGTNDYMDAGNVTAINSVANASYSFWYKTSATGKVGLIGGGLATSVYHWTDGNMYVHAFVGSSVHAITVPTLGSWHHIVCTFGSSESKVYVDGSLQGTISVGGTSDSTSGNNFAVGKASHYNLAYGQKLIDEVALFTSTLSASDVTAIYTSGTPTDLSSYSPVGWWRMGYTGSDYGTATITNAATGSNSGGSAINGTIVNGSSGNTSPTYSTDVPT